jgi:hypothetical protein
MRACLAWRILDEDAVFTNRSETQLTATSWYVAFLDFIPQSGLSDQLRPVTLPTGITNSAQRRLPFSVFCDLIKQQENSLESAPIGLKRLQKRN